jgi:hypothetical protein
MNPMYQMYILAKGREFFKNIWRKAAGGGKEERMERKWQADIEMEGRLRAAGVPLDAGEDDGGIAALPAYGLSIMQTGECSVFDLDPCGVGYTIELRIVPNFPWPFEISTLELDLPWEDTFLHWLPDPLETYAKDGMYWLPTREPLGYPRDQVINHLVGAGKRFSRGRSFGGLLLGVGAPMPDTILQGSEVPALVRISDQFGKQYSSAFSLRASRRTQLQEKRATRKPLFACPDPEKPTKSASRETSSARALVSEARSVSRKKK